MTLQEIVRYNWPNAKFINREQWLSCLEHPEDVRRHYEDWLDKNEAVLYIAFVKSVQQFSLGARYGEANAQYLSPYASQTAMKRIYEN